MFRRLVDTAPYELLENKELLEIRGYPGLACQKSDIGLFGRSAAQRYVLGIVPFQGFV